MERYGRILMKQQEELEMFREKEEKEKEEGEKGEGEENGMMHFCSTHLLLHSNKQSSQLSKYYLCQDTSLHTYSINLNFKVILLQEKQLSRS